MYDFDAEPGSGEVSIRVGDILTVTRTDVGEGWWEGTTPQSQTGLFPEAYVEEISVEETNTAPPAMAPPPLPPDYGAVGAGGAGGAWNLPTAAPAAAAVQDDWDDPWGGGGGGTAPAQQPPQQDWQPDVSLPGSLTLSLSLSLLPRYTGMNVVMPGISKLTLGFQQNLCRDWWWRRCRRCSQGTLPVSSQLSAVLLSFL